MTHEASLLLHVTCHSIIVIIQRMEFGQRELLLPLVGWPSAQVHKRAYAGPEYLHLFLVLVWLLYNVLCNGMGSTLCLVHEMWKCDGGGGEEGAI